MRLSRNFLSSFIDLNDISINDLAQKLLSLGHEFDSIEKLAIGNNLIVGEVIKCDKLPDSDHLHLCKVDIGSDFIDIICGASNVRKGLKVITALPGAKLKNMEIKKTVIRGVTSNGMLCSLEELGISDKYLSEDEKNGIYELPSDAKIGEDALKFLELDDEIIDFDLTSNRGDLQSILGFARESNIFLRNKIKEIEINKDSNIKIDNLVDIKVDSKNTPVYLGLVVKGVKIGPSPNFIKNRLIASGIRPINNLVDISNYVMLEFGQPLHFFDYDKINKNIVVKEADNNDKVVTIDGKERVLSEDDIVITSNDEIIAIAGVMGAKNSEVTEHTSNIFIEAAIFDSYHIRKTSRTLNILSEAASRYVKGLNNEDIYSAIERAAHLLKVYAGASSISNKYIYDVTSHEENIIKIDRNKINKILAINLSINEILDIFDRLGFDVKASEDILSVNVPSYRRDILIEEDLIEEISRVHGINNIVGTLPVVVSFNTGINDKTNKMRKIRDRFISLGFNEVINYTLVAEAELDDFYQNKSFKVASPMSDDHVYTRNSLIPSLYRNVIDNMNRGYKNLSFIEMSKVYELDNTYNLLSGIMTGYDEMSIYNNIIVKKDFYYLKGLMENVLKYIGLNARYVFEESSIKGLHKYQGIRILVNNEEIGIMGMIDPFKYEKEAFIFELNLDKIVDIKVGNIKDKGINLYPCIVKDLAFKVSEDTKYEDVYKLIKNTATSLAESISLFDLYKGKNIEKGYKSLAFKITFRDKEKTLDTKEVNDILNDIIEKASKKGYILRDN